MTDRITILFSAPFSFLHEKEKLYPDEYTVDFQEIWCEEDIPNNVAHYDVWIPNPGQNFVIDSAVLARFSSLRIISTPSTGVNHVSAIDCKKRNVTVLGLLDQRESLKLISASAEFTFLKVLASLRNLREAWVEVDEGRWRHNEDSMRGVEVREKSYGLIGMGRIGNKLVNYLSCFGAPHIYFYDNVVTEDLNKKAKRVSLAYLFRECDVIVVCVALTEETKGLIGADLLCQTKPSCQIINTSRGEVFIEAELIQSLTEREDMRFSTDVLCGEVESGSLNQDLLAMHRRRRINITPHIAGATYGSQSMAAELAFGVLDEYL